MNPRAAVPALALLPVLLAVSLTGCSSTGSDSSSADGGSVAAGDSALSLEAPADRAALEDADGLDASGAYQGKPGPDAPDPMAPAVIRKGNVALSADAVGEVQQEVQKVVDRFGGQVTDEKTTTDEEGEPSYARMVLRIPSADFDEAILALKDVEGAELETAATSEDDVTTKLIDTESRLRAQQRSIARITVLFDRAQSIRDIMAIESELSRRQADLESLQRQLAYLEGQTSLSTITVSIDQTATKPPAEDDDTGFVAGLKGGWHALAAFGVGLATALGAVLPWLVVLAIVGPLVWVLVRSMRRRISARTAARTPSAG